MRGKLNGLRWRISQMRGRRGEEAGDGIGGSGSRIGFCLRPALARFVLRSSRQRSGFCGCSRRRLPRNFCKLGGQSSHLARKSKLEYEAAGEPNKAAKSCQIA